MRPLEGDAFLISATTPVPTAAWRLRAAAQPRGRWAILRSKSASGTLFLAVATVARVLARIVARMVSVRVDILWVEYTGPAAISQISKSRPGPPCIVSGRSAGPL